MTGFYGDNQNALWVDETEDFMLTDINDDALLVDEADVPMEESLLVEEDTADYASLIPGSDVEYVEDEEVEEKSQDWVNDGNHAAFVDYVKDKVKKVPRHSGETISGCERAKAFLGKLDNEISKAMRSDFEGVIDESEIDQLRKSINDMTDRLEKQIKKLKVNGKTADLNVRLVSEGSCTKCDSSVPMWHDTTNNRMVCLHCEADSHADSENRIEKTATTPVLNVYMTPFERAIVGILINSKVSAGRNIEETYLKLKNKYNFNPREELSIQQLVADYGYPVLKDRGLLNEPADSAAGDGIELLTQYHA